MPPNRNGSATVAPSDPDPAELARLQANLVEILGEPDLQSLEADWLAKMLNGVLISLSIGRTGCRASLSEQDLGIAYRKPQQKQRRQAWYDLGNALLLPRRYAAALDSKESTARKWLATCASRTHWGYFLSASAYPRWKEGNERHKTDYFNLRDEIVSNYDTIVAEVCEEHGKLARDAYYRMCRQDKEFRTQHPDPERYSSERIAVVRNRIPTAEAFRDSFYYTVELSYIPLPTLLAPDLAAAEQLREEANAAAALRREAYERALESKQALITLFQRDMIAKVQAMLYDVATDVLSSVRNNGRVIGKSAEQLRNLLAGLEQYLSFAPNEDVEQSLDRIREFLSLAAGEDRKSQVPALERQLTATATLARDVLLRLGDNPRSARELGVPDIPTPDLVRQARSTLRPDSAPATPPAEMLQRRVTRPGALPVENSPPTPVSAGA
jgi:hypothetical protein